MAGGVYTGGGATVVMDPPALVYVKVFHPGSGPERHLKRKAEAVAVLARDLAPLGETGRLKASIRVEQGRGAKGAYAFGFNVYTPIYYGFYVHEGTGPSPRWPVNRKVMKFTGSGGDIVHRDFVMHPGTPAVPFLQNALVAMAD